MAGSVSAGADTATITFASQTSGTGDSSTAYTINNFVSSGIASSDAAFGTISCSATAKCYSGKTGYGMKTGASSSAGSFTISFSSALTNVTQITLNRASYSSTKDATITVKNGTTTLANAVSTPSSSADFADMDIKNLSIASLSGLTVETSRYCYIKSITITYNSSNPAVATSVAIDDTNLTNTDLFTSTAAGSLSATVKDNNNTAISGATVTWSSSDEDVATIASDGTVTLVGAGTTTITASYSGVTGQYKPSSADYELEVTDSNAPQYEWVLTDLANLSIEDLFVIVGTVSNTSYSMSNNSSSNPVASTVTIENGKITSEVTDNIIWAIDGNATDGYTFYPYGTTGYCLYCNTTANSSSNTNLRIGEEEKVTRKLFIPYGTTLKTKDSYTDRYWNVYTSGPDWRGYTSNNTSTTVTFYKLQRVTSVATPTFSLASGKYFENKSVEISCETSGATIYYTTDGTDPTSSSTPYTAAVSITETTTLKAIAIKDGEESNIAIATYTIEQPLNTIETIFAKATSVGNVPTSVNITFNNWVVSACTSRYAFVTDGTNGFAVYDSNEDLDFEANQVLSGSVSCSLELANGYARVSGLTKSTEGLTVTNGGTVTEANVTLANLAGVNTGALVSYENLTCSVSGSTYSLSDGTTTIQLYNLLYDYATNPDLEDGKTYNITGIYQQYNDTKEILPRSVTDIEEVVMPSISLSANSIEAPTAGKSGTITVTYNNITTVAAEVAFYAADGETPATYDWFEAEINDDNNVDYAIYENEGVARTGYMKVWAYDDEMNEVYSELITITQAAYGVPSNFFKKVTSTDDIINGDYLIVYETGNVAFDGGLTTLDAANNTIGVTITDGKIEANSATLAATFTIDVTNTSLMTGTIMSKSGLYIGGTSATNGLSSSETTEYENSLSITGGEADIISSGGAYLRYNSNSDQKRFRYFKSSSYGNQKAIQLYRLTSPLEVKLNSYGYATYCSQYPLDFTNADGYSAWYISNIDNNNVITFSQITGTIKSGQGILLKGGGNAILTLASSPSTNELTDNLFVGTIEPMDIDEGEYYGLKGNTFVPVGAGTVPAGKALLEASYVTDPQSGNARVLTFVFEDASGIATIEHSPMNVEDGIYNLQGQRVNSPKKGLYIVNGKKVMVK